MALLVNQICSDCGNTFMKSSKAYTTYTCGKCRLAQATSDAHDAKAEARRIANEVATDGDGWTDILLAAAIQETVIEHVCGCTGQDRGGITVQRNIAKFWKDVARKLREP